MCVGHDHGSQGIKGQKSRLGSQFETRSMGPWSSIEDSFLVLVTVYVLVLPLRSWSWSRDHDSSRQLRFIFISRRFTCSTFITWL